jgi:NRPS condensation-like uncharacterized protein
MKNIINDTLKYKGKWSRKSLTAFSSFTLGIIYEMILPFLGIVTKEYVFITLLTLTGSVLGLTVWDKSNTNPIST